MRIIKTFVAFITLFLIGVVLLGFLLPSESQVKIEKQLDCSSECVFENFNNLKTWKNWSAWAEMDPDMKTEYDSIYKGAGAKYSWSGNNKVGYGYMKIVNSVPNKSLDMKLKFGEYPETNTFMTVDSLPENMSKVVWGIDCEKVDVPIIGRSLSGLFYTAFKFQINKDFSKGLSNLEALCQK